jgi:hypothetical protein
MTSDRTLLWVAALCLGVAACSNQAAVAEDNTAKADSNLECGPSGNVADPASQDWSVDLLRDPANSQPVDLDGDTTPDLVVTAGMACGAGSNCEQSLMLSNLNGGGRSQIVQFFGTLHLGAGASPGAHREFYVTSLDGPCNADVIGYRWSGASYVADPKVACQCPPSPQDDPRCANY